MSLAESFVEVVPDTRNFGRRLRSDLQRISASPEGRRVGESFSSGFSGGIAGLARLGTKAVLGIGAALGVAAGAAGVLGTKTAAANEQANIAFTTMLGSGQKAQAFLKQLQDFAARTPFEFPELQKSASNLIAIGIESSKVIPIMTTLGNVTSGMGTGAEGVKRATVAIQQMNAAGRITAEDLNQLRDAGIPVFDLLAGATGKTKQELAGMAQNGKLGRQELEQLMKALETGKGLERFNGLMDKQSKSLSGMAATFKDVLGQNLANMITPLIPLMKDGLNAATEALAKILPRVVEGFQSFADYIPKVISGAKGLWAQWQAGEGTIGAVRAVLEDVGTVLGFVGGLFIEGARTVAGWVSQASSGEQQAGTMAKMIRGLGNAVAGAVDWFARHETVTKAVIVAVLGGVAAFKVLQGALFLARAAIIGVNFVLSANPIGVVIVLIAGLAAGLIYAYKHSDKFRSIVDNTWKVVSSGARYMWERVLKPTFRFIITSWLTVAGAVINGAAKAFGWVPGLGPKLRSAATKFNEFKNAVNRSLNRLDDRSITVSAKFRATYSATAGGASLTTANFAKRHGLKDGGPIPVEWVRAARRGFQTGGEVPETINSVRHKDSVEALLVPGEYVVREDGSNLADAMEYFARKRMATGGVVVNAQVPSGRSVDNVAGGVFNRVEDVMAGKIAKTYEEWAERGLTAAVKAAAARAAQTGVGNYRGGNTLARVRQFLGPGLAISSTYRSPARNRAVGGSPTSLHMDARNPAVDIVGSMGALDNLAARLRRAGGWRELLWRVAGHYDHLHVADTGGLIRPGQAGYNRGTRPERILSSDQTEAFDKMVAALVASKDSEGRPWRLHPDDIRALGAELRAGMASANVETARTASVYERTAY